MSDPIRFDVYRTITDSIAAAIAAGAGTFVMPWHGAGAGITRPENAHTRMAYHGINILALWAQAYLSDYPSGYWASYKQWQLLGAQVRKGEHGATIVFYKKLDRDDDDTEAEGAPSPRLIARASRVFNAAQVDGWHPPRPPAVANPAETQASVAAFVGATRAQVVHGASGARYDVVRNLIALPAPEQFIGTPTSTPSEAYQATLLHELVHWTGSSHRLDRGFGDPSMAARAREELVAEIGAAFLCADLGVTNEPRPDHAAYVAHWLEMLANDARALFAASRLATQAATYLHDLTAGHAD